MEKLEEYNDLLSNYEKGLYSNIELISKTLFLLGEGDSDIWALTPCWVKEKIKEKISSVRESDELISFSGRTSEDIKLQIFSLKQWLKSRGELLED